MNGYHIILEWYQRVVMQQKLTVSTDFHVHFLIGYNVNKETQR